ncbi:MAG: hypothetical protein LRY71_13345 [Bacillaceae bacterium]|nr:hypothetical protein [Bacillaceae bacterium]
MRRVTAGATFHVRRVTAGATFREVRAIAEHLTDGLTPHFFVIMKLKSMRE